MERHAYVCPTLHTTASHRHVTDMTWLQIVYDNQVLLVCRWPEGAFLETAITTATLFSKGNVLKNWLWSAHIKSAGDKHHLTQDSLGWGKNISVNQRPSDNPIFTYYAACTPCMVISFWREHWLLLGSDCTVDFRSVWTLRDALANFPRLFRKLRALCALF